MIGRRDHNGVDVLLLIEHLAIVRIDFRPGIFFEDAPGVGGVDVAESDNVFVAELFQIVCTLAADADAGDVEFVVWRCASVEAEDVAGDDHESG